ncbi:hypothetical protein BDK51DRAFT_30895 [Blyttiomyces helicus]|uniref:Uncharacterized protein n=1 Tax=Blyttiomyces helicus TaxID=388810 RepID=A0A4P9VYF8_9FUNG|nr:hypothetical protein BDK51DRAFT_30895 [Blyttiomyces helicus]|eukprot:RKO84302.1 hypothetical protein BDK51DRAFT_30895 [Blyttiomyces helicus]
MGPAGGDWLEPEAGQWGDAENGSAPDEEMIVEWGSAEGIAEMFPREEDGRGDDGKEAARQASDRARRELLLAFTMIRNDLPFLESEGISVEMDDTAKFLAYGAAIEKEAKDGEEGKKRRALGEVAPSVAMMNLVPIDVVKKGEKRNPSWGTHHLK